MSEQIETVARFSDPVEAELAKNRLEAEGIRATLMGELSVNVFSGIGTSVGGVTLQVTAAHLQRAREILAPLLEKTATASAETDLEAPATGEEGQPDAMFPGTPPRETEA